MKIGLVRHFRVKQPLPAKRLITGQELNQWIASYDVADVEPAEPDWGGIDWHHCYASDLPRAVATAEAFFPGEIVKLPALRELQAKAFYEGGPPLPFFVWGILGRLAIASGHKSIGEAPNTLRGRAHSVITQIRRQHEGENVLIVSHTLIMGALRLELLAQGFKGPRFSYPTNGRLYLFER